MKQLRLLFTILAVLAVGGMNTWAETVTYKIASKTSATTTGTAPTGSSASYTQTYATAGQITSSNSATLTLSGYAGYKITGIVLSMKSNAKAGAGTFSTVAGTTTIAAITSATTFNKWYNNTSYGSTYRDVTVTLTNSDYVIQTGESVVITIAGTTKSLYIQSYTITYESGASKTTVSLTPSVTPKDAGSVVLTQGGNTTTNEKIDIEENTEVTATATPNAGYTFANWSIDGATIKSQTENTAVITMGITNATITATFQETPTCTTTLATPTGLTVSALTTTTAELSWTAVENATKYQVTVMPATGGTAKTYTTESTTLTADGLTAETAYTWTVQAIGDATYCDSETATGSNFTTAALPKYTVTFKVGTGSSTTPAPLTETSAGAGVTLPDVTDLTCEDWQFAGWAEAAVATATTTAPATLYATSSTYKPSAATTLYAVYSKTESTGPTGAAVGTILWAEDFTHFEKDKTPADAGTGTGTTIYGGAIITYTSSGSGTKSYEADLAGGTSPELLLAKKSGTWTISGIATGSASEMALTLLSNKTSGMTLSSQSSEISISSVSNNSISSWTITNKNAAVFDLTFSNTSSDNIRLDDIKLTVTKTSGSSTTTYYSNPTCTPVPTLSVSGEDIASNAITFAKTEVGKTDTKSFTLSGKNMSADATLAITGDNASMFSVSPATAAQTDGSLSSDVTVTYQPTAAGNHTATLTISSTDASDITLALKGTAYATYTVQWSVCGDVDATLTQQVESGTALTFPTAPTKEGLIFYGWTTEENKNYYSADTPPAIVGTATTVTGDVTYYAVFAQSKDGESGYTKVTADRDDWAGEYLIVSEGSNVAFDGSLTNLDVSGNMKSVTIKNNNIAFSTELDAATFTIAKTGTSYTIQSKSGYYIGRTATTGNGLDADQTKVYTNTISYSSTSNSIVIKGSGGATLQYYNTSNSERFRYYKSAGQQPIQLYEKEDVFNYNTNCAAVTFYSITPSSSEGGTITVSHETAIENEVITVTVKPLDDYTLDKVVYNDGTDHTITITNGTGTFTMPAANVTVTATFSPILVTGISVTPATVNLRAGQSQALAVKVTPDNAHDQGITWSTTNAAVATVSVTAEGTFVVAHSAGSATITAASEDGSGITAKVSVTVAAANTYTYIDALHGNDAQTLAGKHTVPFLENKQEGEGQECRYLHYHFVGWTKTTIESDQKTAPTDLLRAGQEVDANDDNTPQTYYAVWAEPAN